ncbi:hypothetical protein K469DRAFT_615345 [Zopfia rhizophila CBS 207.26]|uniref:Phosphatidate phosphatase APP1 catalytic domain-containing protein n=1 Tax=Zopfia rhizophila CBS 207.26 TaxID=1314779 RepID=A0A6A6EVR9_9PEZI|nr:hypothetical protein K469DRAFT_615345 [Zopfia rhizophila CBS 207.26]
MHYKMSQWLLLAAANTAAIHAAAIPDPTAAPVQVEVRAPIITPAAIRFDGSHSYMLDRRGKIEDILSGVNDKLHSIGSILGTDVPSYVVSGVPNFFQGFPTGDDVKSKASLKDDDIDALPTSALNIPPYANWTDDGWNVRFHGNVYKMPNISQDTIDDLAGIFLIDVDIKDLSESEKANARNLTKSIFIIQQGDQDVSFHLEPAPSQGSSGEPGGGGAVTPPGGSQNISFPNKTTGLGGFDAFVPINVSGLLLGNETDQVQRLNVYTNGTVDGNATAFLVPPEGITILSDIDDILRVTKIYEPKEGLLNSFAKDFRPWENMPEIYANWSRSLPNSTHFHYLTTTPEQATRNYMDFIYKTYPGGSFDTRPLNFSDVSATLSIRRYLLNKIFETFPRRKFVLVADNSNSDIMKEYPQLALDRPNQIQCILIRNTSATDENNVFPYDTKVFEKVDNRTYMFFKVPDDLKGLDIAGGQCRNDSIAQNVTFGLQDEVLGIHGAGEKLKGGAPVSFVVALAASIFLIL